MLIGVVIPVYNERRMLPVLMARVDETTPPAGCERVVVLVDDASVDGSGAMVEAYGERADVVALRHERNAGKGAAVRTGFEAALGLGAGVVIIQDADLEYDPADHDDVLRPILEGGADVVIGSRFVGGRALRDWDRQYVANRVITALSNVTTGLALTDVECCFKAFTRAVLERVSIEEDRFGLEPELVAKVARVRLPGVSEHGHADVAMAPGSGRPARVVEVGVSFSPRSRREGKKIGWRDGVSALRCIARYAAPSEAARRAPAPEALLREAFSR